MSPGKSNGGGSAKARSAKGAGSFVNPYTFLPWPVRPGPDGGRSVPAGHHRLGGEDGLARFAGSVTVELTCRSPLLIRNVVRECANAVGEDGLSFARFPRRAVPGAQGMPERTEVPFVPGSSLAGVFRSLHEALAGGCLRVFDAGFVPGYRDKALAGGERDELLGLSGGQWRLARVDAVDTDGVPVSVRLCDEDVVWIPVEHLAKVLGGPRQVCTGAQVAVLKVPSPDSLGRRKVESADGVGAGQGWTILVTDAKARPKQRKDKTPATYYCVAGRLEPSARAVELDDGVWQRYVAAARGSDDMRQARRKQTELVRGEEPVCFRDRHVGVREAVRDRLFAGQVVWLYGMARKAPVDGEPVPVRVQAISLGQIWRHSGSGQAGERVPDWLLPCDDPEWLCPSCRVFGAADTLGADDPQARQQAYRGHVRFSDALPVGEVGFEVYALAPLAAPRPGAGQMYLQHTEQQLEGKARKPAIRRRPLREWGADFDGGRQDGYPDADMPGGRGLRPLRGRKQYWLTGAPAQRPYFRANGEHGPEVFPAMYDQSAAGPAAAAASEDDAETPEAAGENALLSRGEAAMTGVRFQCRVHFENLTAAELGGLLVALDPRLLLDQGDGQGEFGIAIGGGRPLGFGTCVTSLHDLVIEDAASRYLGGDIPRLDAPAAVAVFREANQAHMAGVWEAAGQVLQPGAVPDWQVWYPPARALAQPDRKLDPAALVSSFTFWDNSQGFRGKKVDSVWPLVSLPVPGPGRPQTLPVSPDDDQYRLASERLAAQPPTTSPGAAGPRSGGRG